MPIGPRTFASSRALAAPDFRAYASVVLVEPLTGLRTLAFDCLVDTGSDYTILPIRLATSIGIVPSGPSVSVTAVGGTVLSFPSHAATDLEICGYALTAIVLFSAAPGFQPILGRMELIDTFDSGFSPTDWHWG